jgi:hypothetical protein
MVPGRRYPGTRAGAAVARGMRSVTFLSRLTVSFRARLVSVQ